MLTDLQLMEQHVDVLFRKDSNNRLTTVNEPPFNVAPKIFIGSTILGKVVRYSNLVENNLIENLQEIVGTNLDFQLGSVINLLTNDERINNFWIGPAYIFSEVKDAYSTNVVRVTHENKELLKLHFPYTYEDFAYKEPCFVILDNSRPVSICCSARQTSKAAEASVITHEEYRGRGYGLAVTKAWATEVQKQGRLALYSTSWDNFASQALARKLHLIQYGIDIHIS